MYGALLSWGEGRGGGVVWFKWTAVADPLILFIFVFMFFVYDSATGRLPAKHSMPLNVLFWPARAQTSSQGAGTSHRSYYNFELYR